MTIPNQDLKRCRTCKKKKSKLAGFYGRQTECKICYGKRAKRNRKLHGAAWNAYLRTRREGIRIEVFNAYGGLICACCGETELSFLSLDHVNNDGANWRRRRFSGRHCAGYTTYAWLRNNKFPPGFQVLCMNCNHGKRMNHGICPHQVRRNDQEKSVGSSDPKRAAPSQGEDMV